APVSDAVGSFRSGHLVPPGLLPPEIVASPVRLRNEVSDGGFPRRESRARLRPMTDLIATGHMTTADLAAFGFLVLGWLVFGVLVEHPPRGRPSGAALMTGYRREWMRQFVTRQPRIFDASVMDSLRPGTGLLAPATIVAIGGGVALLGHHEPGRGPRGEDHRHPSLSHQCIPQVPLGAPALRLLRHRHGGRAERGGRSVRLSSCRAGRPDQHLGGAELQPGPAGRLFRAGGARL